MARHLIILALALFAVVGFAAAAAPAVSQAASPERGDNGVIGNVDSGSAGAGDDDAEPGPVGGPVPDGVFTPVHDVPAPAPSAASAVEVSAIAGVAAAVVASVFF